MENDFQKPFHPDDLNYTLRCDVPEVGQKGEVINISQETRRIVIEMENAILNRPVTQKDAAAEKKTISGEKV